MTDKIDTSNPKASETDHPASPADGPASPASPASSGDATQLNQADLLPLLQALGNIQHAILSGNRELEDTEKVVLRAAHEVADICQDHPDRGILWSNLANRFWSRYKRSGDPEDLLHVCKWGEETVAATPPDNPNWGNRLNNLGNWVDKRYCRFGVLEDLEQAITCGEEAMAANPNHPDRVSRLSNLGTRLRRKYEQLGSPDDLKQAIRRTEEALAGTTDSPEDPNRAAILNNLGNWFHTRYGLSGDPEDLEEAIKRGEEAVAANPSDNINQPGRLNNLAAALHSRYSQSGDLGDLEQAIQLGEQAVATALPPHPARACILSSHGARLQAKFHRFGALGDIEQAIKWGEEAVETTFPGDPDRAGRLNSLGHWYHSRYEWFKALEDLGQAIKQGEEVLAATPPNHADRAGRLKSLSALFRSRYERSGVPRDLEQAIKLAKQAVVATPQSHPARAGRLSELSIILARKHEDLERAIKQGEEEVAATTENHPERAGRLSKLGTLIGRRNKDLELAIKRGEEALAATTPETPSRAGIWNNLGTMFQTKYEQAQEVALEDIESLRDIEKAIGFREEALNATPPDHPFRAAMLNNLADLLRIRYQQNHSDNLDDFQRSICLNREAWHCKLSPPRDRITGARVAAVLLATPGNWQESSTLLEDAVRLLPNVSPRFLERDDQEHTLSDFTRLAADAASTALQAGAEASHALRLLELGRGVIMGLLIDCRIDLSESRLQVENSEFFDKFNRLRTQIDSPLVTMPEGLADPHTRRQRLQEIHELEEILTHIRQLPSFEGFLLPPRSEDLMSMAGEGPIVILNSTVYRSDAIIVTISGIKALELPGLLFKDVTERMRRSRELVRGKRSTYPLRNKQMGEFLRWLWDAAVGPVLEELQLGDSNQTRIWWIGVGPLGMAPFHAAGDHSPGSTQNTLSRVISSYIPTIKALSYARQKKLEFGGPDSRLLLVAMPTTPTKNDLKNAIPEVERIARVVKGQADRLDHPSADQVLEKLPSYHAIHFACHGVSDAQKPSNSHLLLEKHDPSSPKSKPGTLDRLTVGTISTRLANIKNAQLAYHSACSTADNPSVVLADESIHIASGFQLAGFSHVLATLWESKDEACPQVAGDFYELLFNGQIAAEGHSKISSAFHNVVKKLRDKNLNQPLIWAPFIHTGA
ncbi:hypothetical protein Q9L58_009294 [Maublancomyces gigas]|uniref:CHAT domain-containing protein n=1 Tax=Discina gigas TaxID=1032678 RepID=A0ABR3G7A8_9PEZI